MAKASLYKNKRRFGAFRAHRTILFLLTAVLLLGVMAGCAGNNNNAQTGPRAQSYGNDGYSGLSNTNPHLVTRQNGQQLNYKSDAAFAAAQLRTLQGIDKMSMSFQGPNLYVTIKPKPDIDEMQLRHRAIGLLRYNMPRYTVHVNVVK